MKGVDTQYVVTTSSARMSVLGAPTSNVSHAVSLPTRYNILENLGKTPAQISILDFLKTSPTHQDILTHTLQEAHIPSNIDPT